MRSAAVTPTADCPRCLTPLPASAPDGLCPSCLLAGVLAETDVPAGRSVPRPPPSREELATLFPALELLDLLGSNMGTVYRARHRALDRPVVLKAFTDADAPADGERRERFRREAATLAGLRHPNVVAVFDAGRADGVDYFVMDYVDGETLRQAAARLGPDPAARAAAVAGWVGAVCDALQYVHDRGVVHRDVKPENVVVRADGVPVLIDFGLATGGRRAALTRTAQGMGSGYYAAPEQHADAAAVDRRADVFAVGVVLHELWTGRPPVGQLPAADAAATPLDRAVLGVARKAMSQNPDDRYPTADSLRLALETAVDRHSSTPTDPTAPNTCSRHLTPRQIVGVVALLLVAVGLVAGAVLGVNALLAKTGGTPTTAPKSRAESVMADLRSDDPKVRLAGVKRFAELDHVEQAVLQYPIEDALKAKLDDPTLFRLATTGPEQVTEREKEWEPFLKSAKHRAHFLESRELLACYALTQEAEARRKCAQNLKQIGVAMHDYQDAAGAFPPGFADPSWKPGEASWATYLLPYIEQDNVYKAAGGGPDPTKSTEPAPPPSK